MLYVKNLVSGYGRMKILYDVSLNIEKREIVGVVGPNGAGKTTLFNSITGLARIFSGEIWFTGRRIDGIEPEKLPRMGIAYVPQLSNVFPSLTVEENLLVAGEVLRDRGLMRDSIEKVYSIFPILRERRGQRAGTLSGGERQMLAIARGLVQNPRLLLLDEPMTGLSPKIISTIVEKLLEIRESGVSILLTEQNLRVALKVSDRIYVLVSGRIVAEGAPDKFSIESLSRLFFKTS